MPSRVFLLPIFSSLIVGIVLLISPGWAATAIVKEGNTIQLGEVIYRLDGIEAPEIDQTCIDDQADPWTCGVDAREQLTKLNGGKLGHCDDRVQDMICKLMTL